MGFPFYQSKKAIKKRISNGENEILLTNYKPKYEEHKYSVKSTLSNSVLNI